MCSDSAFLVSLLNTYFTVVKLMHHFSSNTELLLMSVDHHHSVELSVFKMSKDEY